MRKKVFARAGAALLTGALLASSLSVGSAFAADNGTAGESSTEVNNKDVTMDLSNSDIIDTSKTGSITIHKYDTTAATQDGVYDANDTSTATGKTDSSLENNLADYAIAGVEFTYLKVGDIEQYSYTTGGTTQVNLVYEIPEKLAAILGLADTNGYVLYVDDSGNVKKSTSVDSSLAATNMTATGVSTTCTESGVYHYTSDQIDDALQAILVADDVAAKNALEAYIVSAGGTAMDLTDANGTTSKDGLDLGLYLLVETAVPENVTETVNPFFVSLPMTNLTDDDNTETGGTSWFYDVVVYPKNQTGNPTLDKMVRNATGTASTKAGTAEGTDYVVSNYTDDYDTYGVQSSTSGTVAAEEFVTTRGDETYATTDNGLGQLSGANTFIQNSNNGTTSGSAISSAETVIGEYQYASTTTASDADVLDYILVSKLPHISSTATYLTQYTFVDELGEGISYNGNVSIAFYSNAADAYINNTVNAVDIWTLDAYGSSSYYTVSYKTNNTTGAEQMTVTFTDAGIALINGSNTKADANNGTTGYSDYYMVVYYNATVNSDSTVVLGDEGNVNDVELTWERTSDEYIATLQDECYVYVYGIDLTKSFSDNAGDYSKVTFNMYNKTDGYYIVAEYDDDDEVYYVTGKTATQGTATKFTVNGSGKLVIYGLEGDCYSLTELTTDNGYSLLADQIIVDINTASRSIQAAIAGWTGLTGYNNGQQNGLIAMIVGDVVKATATVDDVTATMLSSGSSANAIVSLAVTNTSTFTLPLTGGAGLYLVTILGVIAVAGGCYLAFGRKKKDKDQMAAAA